MGQSKEWDKVIQKEEPIQVESKRLKLAVATMADSTASILLDIWEEHIQSIEIGKVYLMKPLQVRIWSNKKKTGNLEEDQHYAIKRRPRTK